MIRCLRRHFFASALVVAAFAVLLAPGAALAGGPGLTLEASKKQLGPGKTTDLSGTLTGVFSGNDGKTVTLLASPYPYESESVAGTTTTGPNGGFSFQNVEPELNTRYRASFNGDVLDGDAESGVVQVFVNPSLSFDYSTDPVRPISHAQATIGYSEAVQPEYLPRKPIFWYFKKTSQKRFKRVETTRLKDTFEGVVGRADIKLPLSRRGYRYELAFCVDEPAKDIGVGDDKPYTCPRRSFRTFRSVGPLIRSAGITPG